MTNYEYILGECKKAHYGQWEEIAIECCIEKTKSLTRNELLNLFTSRWLKEKCEVRDAIFSLLFKDQLERRETMILDAIIDELGSMLTEKDGNHVKRARKELKERYQHVGHDDQMLIIKYFKQANGKQDKKWGEVREKWQKLGYANPPSIFDTLELKKRH